ncbi:MAG: DHHA1 domain-containing protein, partial [Cyanobacteria bacterium P01_H01_bin.130]
DHPLATLSGVAVAFKLVEALYESLPTVPAQPLEDLLDLVAIGLIADLVELRGDCRYLAQRGIERLRQTQRPGLQALLKSCKRQGDRPTDIGFGIGPRINAISRIQGDAQFAVNLLTSGDREVCQRLAMETELANSRRKELQRRLGWEIEQELDQMDLSTTAMVVMARPGWRVGVLGLVAGQLSDRLKRPVLLLAIDGEWARGSARSVAGINLYELLERHRSLLHKYGGHPMAAGVMVKTEMIALLTQALNHDLGQQKSGAIGGDRPLPLENQGDLTVTVADLDHSLFQELKLLEPCGMGNPPPKLLVKNAWFTDVRNSNLRDASNVKLKYIRTTFSLCDDTQPAGCEGTWWGHYQHELPTGPCNALVELDFNARRQQYEVRLLAVEAVETSEDSNKTSSADPAAILGTIRIYDWRNLSAEDLDQAIATCPEEVLEVPVCPQRWPEWQTWIKRAIAHRCALALTFVGQPQDVVDHAQDIYRRFVGIAKYLGRSGEGIYRTQLQTKLGFTPALMSLGIGLLKQQGMAVTYEQDSDYLKIVYEAEPIASAGLSSEDPEDSDRAARLLIDAIQEHIFQQNYFSRIPVQIIRSLDSSLMETEAS